VHEILKLLERLKKCCIKSSLMDFGSAPSRDNVREETFERKHV